MDKPKLVQSKHLPLALIDPNTGQVEGLPKNPRLIRDKNFKKLKQSIEDNPEMTALREILVYPQGDRFVIIGGNMRYEAMKSLGLETAPCKVIPKDTPVEKLRQIVLKDNSGFGEWDYDLLGNDWDKDLIDACCIEIPDLDPAGGEEEEDSLEIRMLKEDFLFPPFSVLDSTTGEWMERKNEWKSMGIKSELGRDEQLTYSKSRQTKAYYSVKNELRKTLGREPTTEEVYNECKNRDIALLSGTSIFDPVLCELMYRWFCPRGGRILDPFAGGSVRGIVASHLGFKYVGNDLRDEQIQANRKNAAEVFENYTPPYQPRWTVGDSTKIDEILEAEKIDGNFDMIFSCPPYADLEVYSDRPEDISNMDYPQFIEAYKTIIKKTVERLNNNRFAVFVVGDVRDRKGYYRNFVNDTIRIFEDCGMHYYNQLIFMNSLGSLAFSIRHQMNVSRKIGKRHQNVVVFTKGDNIEEGIEKMEQQNVTKLWNDFGKNRRIHHNYDDLLVFYKDDDGKNKIHEFGPVAAETSNTDKQ